MEAGSDRETRDEKREMKYFVVSRLSFVVYIRGVIGWRSGAIKRETGEKPVLFP